MKTEPRFFVQSGVNAYFVLDTRTGLGVECFPFVTERDRVAAHATAMADALKRNGRTRAAKVVTVAKLREFLAAVEAACPPDVARDRFNRVIGPRDTNKLHALAVEFDIENGGQDTLDQAAMIARKMLACPLG